MQADPGVEVLRQAGSLDEGVYHRPATDSKGNIYVAQAAARMQKQTFKGMSLVR